MSLNDPMIRKALMDLLKPTDGLWVREEVKIHESVIDVLTVDDQEIHGYEIKSDRDTTTRLQPNVKTWRWRGRKFSSHNKGQIECYGMVCDRVTLVAGKTMVKECMAVIPEWWGVMVATPQRDEISIREIRPATINPDVRWAKVCDMLWRNESLRACQQHGIGKGMRSASKANLKKRLKEHLTLDQIREVLRDALRNRQWIQDHQGTWI